MSRALRDPSFWSKKKYLYVSNTSGLCNRLYALTGSMYIAERMNRELVLHWPSTMNLTGEFNDLFENKITLFDPLEDLHNLLHVQNTIKIYQPIPGDDNYMYIDENEVKDTEIILVKTWTSPGIKGMNDFPMYRRQHVQKLIPVLSIRDKLNTLNFGKTVGIHIRRSDQIHAKDDSPDVYYIELIEEIKRTNNKTTFFLATECKETENKFISLFPDIMYFPKTYYDMEARLQPIGSYEALLDLYGLSRTRVILGSHHSSYSLYAGEIEYKPVFKVDMNTLSNKKMKILHYIENGGNIGI